MHTHKRVTVLAHNPLQNERTINSRCNTNRGRVSYSASWHYIASINLVHMSLDVMSMLRHRLLILPACQERTCGQTGDVTVFNVVSLIVLPTCTDGEKNPLVT